MIIGTAGHVDHGKTSLVKALTGIDTDRLPEEKKRGITLELGFAHLTLPSGRTVGVVDVPGHERFVKAMAAGAGGVDVALLVIAADEGVMPQTREHLDICSLLGVRAGVVVLTKSDLLPALGPDWRGLLEADVAQAVAGSVFEGAPVVDVSARTGAGLDALVQQLDAVLAALGADRRSDAPLFLPLDRAFLSRGFGLVATGSLLSGRMDVGEALLALPGGTRCRARSLQVHGQAVTSVGAGSRVAVNLPDLSLDDVGRGQVLVREGELDPSRVVEVSLRLLPSVDQPLPRRSRALMTLGTSQREVVVRLLDLAELRPGETGFAQVHFGGLAPALVGQRFILRGPRRLEGRGATIAGGTVLVVAAPRRRAGRAGQLARWAELPLDERVRGLVNDAGYEGLPFQALFARAGASLKDLERAVEVAQARGSVVVIDREARRLVAADVLSALGDRVRARLEGVHQTAPERAGVPREELRQRVGAPPERVLARVLDGLLARKVVELVDDLWRLPGRGGAVTREHAARLTAMRAVLEERGLMPPTLAEWVSTQRLSETQVVQVAQALVASGAAVKAGDLFFSAAAVEGLRQKVLEWFTRHERLEFQALKELSGGLTRKFLIPLAELFDREKLTLRVGETRVLRKR